MKNGFSLIELMVVIAIIGVLSLIAVPSYKSYVVTAKFANSANVFQNLVDRAILFSSVNGAFPSLYDLGLTTTPGQSFADDNAVESLPNYLSLGQSGGVWLNKDPANCGQFMNVVMYLDPAALGFSSDVATNGNVSLICQVYHYQGTIYKACFYSYGTASVSGTDDVLPGWENANTTASWDQDNQQALNDLESYQNASCQ